MDYFQIIGLFPNINIQFSYYSSLGDKKSSRCALYGCESL